MTLHYRVVFILIAWYFFHLLHNKMRWSLEVTVCYTFTQRITNTPKTRIGLLGPWVCTYKNKEHHTLYSFLNHAREKQKEWTKLYPYKHRGTHSFFSQYKGSGTFQGKNIKFFLREKILNSFLRAVICPAPHSGQQPVSVWYLNSMVFIAALM